MDTVRILGFKEIFRETEFANAHSNGDLDKCAEAVFALCFFLGADQNRYGSLFSTLDTDTLLGNDQYPTDIGTAFDILCCYNNNGKKNNRNRGDLNQIRDRETEQTEPHYMFLQAGRSRAQKPMERLQSVQIESTLVATIVTNLATWPITLLTHLVKE